MMQWFSFWIWLCIEFCDTNGFIVPDEVPTALSVIYSNIPKIKLGSDSRIGWGFRFGDRADAQVLLELGPQQYTQPLANQQPFDNPNYPELSSSLDTEEYDEEIDDTNAQEETTEDEKNEDESLKTEGNEISIIKLEIEAMENLLSKLNGKVNNITGTNLSKTDDEEFKVMENLMQMLKVKRDQEYIKLKNLEEITKLQMKNEEEKNELKALIIKLKDHIEKATENQVNRTDAVAAIEMNTLKELIQRLNNLTNADGKTENEEIRGIQLKENTEKDSSITADAKIEKTKVSMRDNLKSQRDNNPIIEVQKQTEILKNEEQHVTHVNETDIKNSTERQSHVIQKQNPKNIDQEEDFKQLDQEKGRKLEEQEKHSEKLKQDITMEEQRAQDANQLTIRDAKTRIPSQETGYNLEKKDEVPLLIQRLNNPKNQYIKKENEEVIRKIHLKENNETDFSKTTDTKIDTAEITRRDKIKSQSDNNPVIEVEKQTEIPKNEEQHVILVNETDIKNSTERQLHDIQIQNQKNIDEEEGTKQLDQEKVRKLEKQKKFLEKLKQDFTMEEQGVEDSNQLKIRVAKTQIPSEETLPNLEKKNEELILYKSKELNKTQDVKFDEEILDKSLQKLKMKLNTQLKHLKGMTESQKQEFMQKVKILRILVKEKKKISVEKTKRLLKMKYAYNIKNGFICEGPYRGVKMQAFEALSSLWIKEGPNTAYNINSTMTKVKSELTNNHISAVSKSREENSNSKRNTSNLKQLNRNTVLQPLGNTKINPQKMMNMERTNPQKPLRARIRAYISKILQGLRRK